MGEAADELEFWEEENQLERYLAGDYRKMSSQWNNLTGVWESQLNGNMSMQFKLTAELKEKLNAVPTGTFIKLFPNTRKTEDTPTAPDWNMTWKPAEPVTRGNKTF